MPKGLGPEEEICVKLSVRRLTNIYRFTFFFHLFFLIADFCLFCRKGKSSVLTGQPFFLLPPRVSQSTMLGILTYFMAPR